MTIMLKARRAAVLAACAVAAVFGLLTAAPAQAQSIAPQATVVGSTAVLTHAVAIEKAAGVSPSAAAASSCDIVYWRATSSQLCYAQNYYDGGNPYRWPVYELDLRAYSNRVWLHQGEDGSGWSICLTGGLDYIVTGVAQDPGSILVSANTAPC